MSRYRYLVCALLLGLALQFAAVAAVAAVVLAQPLAVAAIAGLWLHHRYGHHPTTVPAGGAR